MVHPETAGGGGGGGGGNTLTGEKMHRLEQRGLITEQSLINTRQGLRPGETNYGPKAMKKHKKKNNEF